MKTLKVSLAIGQLVRRDGFACRDEGQREKPLGSRMMKVNAFSLASFGDDVQEPHKGVILQSQSQEELSPSFHCGDAPRDALLPSVLRPSGVGV